MSLIDIIYNPPAEWTQANEDTYNELFGAGGGRYPLNAKESFKVRAPLGGEENFVRYAAYINPNNPNSGPYGGTSFVIFPIPDGPCLVGLGVGTQGLNPDEMILSRPGHARRVSAICDYVNSNNQNHARLSWAKSDPTRIDISIPDSIKTDFSEYANVFSRYGNVMYAIFKPTENRDTTTFIVHAFLDLLFKEKGYRPLTAYQSEANHIEQNYLSYIFPTLTEEDVIDTLQQSKYVILEGPPGTGKTRLAQRILKNKFKAHGKTIQFHPNTTYENFIGGLSAVDSNAGLGFSFKPTPGFLIDMVKTASNDPKNDYLLHIDEINRADLAKVLGEGIFLFEPNPDIPREIKLPYAFESVPNTLLSLPPNLYILGTMNSSDRSIAILDIAIRRRFSFMKLWPSLAVVKENACKLMIEMYAELIEIFINNANSDALNLLPGHSYFLQKETEKAKRSLKTSLYPLLEEYLAQGYVSGFSEHLVAYMQKIRSL